jgi:hypothetical protein
MLLRSFSLSWFLCLCSHSCLNLFQAHHFSTSRRSGTCCLRCALRLNIGRALRTGSPKIIISAEVFKISWLFIALVSALLGFGVRLRAKRCISSRRRLRGRLLASITHIFLADCIGNFCGLTRKVKVLSNWLLRATLLATKCVVIENVVGFV